MLRIRDPILIAGLALAVLVAVVAGTSSLSWVGKTFPGFLVLENRVVASAGLAHWPVTRSGDVYQQELVQVAGVALEDPRDLESILEAQPRREAVAFLLRRGGEETTWTGRPRVFTWTDFALLQGTLLFCGLGLAGIGLVIRFLRGRDRVARGTSVSLWIVGLYALTAVDLYGPYRFFRVHAFLECLLFAAVLHSAVVFPQPMRLLERAPWLVPAGYGAAIVLAIAMQAGLYDPSAYVLLHRTALNAFALSLVAFIARQIHAFVRPPSFDARQRVKVVALGTVAALTPQVAIMAIAATTGGRVPENLMSLTGIFFPISLTYAVLRQDLFGVDAILRRTLNWALFSGMVALGYVALVASFGWLLQSSGRVAGPSFLAGVASVVTLLPLRNRVQNAVDRLFFRSAYDFRRLVEDTSAKLASVTDLRVIARELERALHEALQPQYVALDVRRGTLQRVLDTGAPTPLDPALAERAAAGDQPIELPGDGLAIPFRADGRLVALLTLGRRLSGRFYGGDDRRLLLTLANQGAVAIENAMTLEALEEFNRSLEEKVSARTAQLDRTLTELRATQGQLVQQEKMASLGQLVAGVAHEINNPVNFIQGNICFLEEHTAALVEAFERLEKVALDPGANRASDLARIREECELEHVFADLPRAFESCRDGLERTTTIIRDLRSFSRHDGTSAQRIDLHDAIDSTVSLLASRLNGIDLVRDYGELPEVECLGAQLSQVFMNLLTNAADATGEGGRIVIRTRPEEDGVSVEVEDDGCGIETGTLDRIFDPFFSTKEVGKGTGLGLAITYGIISRHGGRITVRSDPGRGACFRIELPLEIARAPRDDREVSP